jgi:tetratricopeptide (TPR) repeat protein
MRCRKARWVLAILLSLGLWGPTLVSGQSAGAAGADREWRFIEELRADGMVDVAAGQLQAFARDYPDDPRAPLAWLNAGRIHEELGQTVAARSDYESLLAHFPSSEEAPDAALRRAVLLADTQDFEAAANAYRSLLEAYPAAAQVDGARLGLGEALMALQEDASARSMLRRLIAGRADADVAARARYDLGILAERSESDSLAVDRFDSVARLHPDQAIAALALLRAARLLRSSEEFAAATRRYEQLLELDTAPLLRGRARFGLAELLSDRDPSAAMAQYESIASEGASSEQLQRALLDLAALALREEDRGRSRRASEAYLEAFPDGSDNDRAQLLLARADLGERGDATERLTRLSRSDDATVSWDAARVLGNWYFQAERYRDSMRAQRRAESVALTEAQRAEALLDQARAALAAEEASLAADLAQQSADVADEDLARARALLLGARALEAAGQRVSAIASVEELVQRHPLTASASEGRALLSELRRRVNYQPAEAARHLAELAARPIEDVATRAVEIGRILRDELGDTDAAASSFRRALASSSVPATQSQAGWEIAFTLRGQALELGLAGNPEAARAKLLQAREALTDAAARAGAGNWAMKSRVALIGLDLANAARPDAPWLFDADRMPLLGAVGPAESMNRNAEGLQATKSRLVRALDQKPDSSDRAWLVWRDVELSGAPVEDRVAALVATSKLDLPRERRLQLRYALGQLYLEQKDATRAAAELSRILEEAPASDLAVAARYGLAEAHRAQRNYGAAYDLYLAFAASYPQSVRGQRALLLAGDCAFLGGNSARAVPRYRELIARYPDTVYMDDALYRLGTALQRSGRVSAAREALQQLLRWPKSTDYQGRALARLAQLEVSAGRDSIAVITLRRLQTIDPERAVAEGAGLSIAQLELGQEHFVAALSALDALPEAEQSVEASAIRIRALSGSGRLAEALRRWESLRVAAPDQASLVAQLRCEVGEAFADAGDADAAVASFEFVVSESRDAELLARAHYQRGVLAARARDVELARAEFQRATSQQPTSDWTAEALYQLGTLQVREGRPDAAQKSFARVFAEFPSHAKAGDALSAEALAWRRMARYDEALERYHTLLEHYPERDGAEKVLSNIAYCHHEIGQFDVAIEAYRRVMPYLDEEGQAYAEFWVADSLVGLERFDEAAAAFLRIPYLYPSQGQLPVTAQLKAAEVYERMGNSSAAFTLYQKVIRAHGATSQWGSEAQRRMDRLAGGDRDES